MQKMTTGRIYTATVPTTELADARTESITHGSDTFDGIKPFQME